MNAEALAIIRELLQTLSDVEAVLILDAGWTRDCYTIEQAEAAVERAEAFLKTHAK